VAEVPALLGWWESEDESAEKPDESELVPASDDLTGLTAAEADIYAMIMGRGPGLGTSARASAPNQRLTTSPASAGTAKPSNPFLVNKRASIPLLQNGKAANSVLGNGRSAPATAPQAGAVLAAPKCGPVRPTAEPTRAHPKGRVETDEVEKPILRTCNARILDISQSGISLLCDAAPKGDPPVWVCLQGAQPAEWVEASIRALSLKEPGMYVIRLEFHDICPYEFFKAAVYGYFGS
jgi:hypothetical protein